MFFQEVEEAQPDAIFGLLEAFKKDPRTKKVNLSIGVYQDEHLRSEIFHSARRAKEFVFEQDVMGNYLAIDGLKEFSEAIGELLFGSKDWKEQYGRIYSAQAVGGTGALCLGAEFASQFVSKKMCIPNYTWPNHRWIFQSAGFEVDLYPYYCSQKKGFDCEAMLAFLSQQKEKTIVVLHVSCHNPTGCDPTPKEWKEISSILKHKRLIPFFDCAYQGLGDGIEQDAESVRFFLKEGHEMIVAYSCSKNFSMYCQRVGALFIVGENGSIKHRIGSQIKRIIRRFYSNPPAHGAKIVETILKHSELRHLWEKDLEQVRHRLNLMRASFVQRLLSGARQTDFECLKQHKGMFSFIDWDPSHVKALMDRYGIYLAGNGRMNVSGLTTKNIDYVVHGLVDILTSR